MSSTGLLCSKCCCSGLKEIITPCDKWRSPEGCKYLVLKDLHILIQRWHVPTSFCILLQAAALKGSDHRRATNVSARLDAQQKKLNLPVLPTTTIGSFPQTVELRRVRREYKAKKWVTVNFVASLDSMLAVLLIGNSHCRISEEEYVSAIKEEINKVVKLQEELDIDVLVHGEPEVSSPEAILLASAASLRE